MSLRRYLLSALALFVFIFMYEMLVHGFILMGVYEATADVWRDFTKMEANMPLAMGFQLALSAWTAFVFALQTLQIHRGCFSACIASTRAATTKVVAAIT